MVKAYIWPAMSTDTRHPQYDDATLQAAIDEAVKEAPIPIHEGPLWLEHAPARLALARGLLARLPESQPPTADGKTPGQVLHEASRAYDEKENDAAGWKSWDQIDCQKLYEAGASAVLAAFGGAETLRWKESAQSIREQINAQQARAEKAEAELAMSEAAFSNYRGLILSTLNEVGAPTHHPDVGASARKPMTPQERIKALCGLSTLPPEAKAPAVEAAKPAYVGHMTDEMPTKPEPSPQPSPPPWQPAVGDVVRLKSGGPAMTASELRPDGWACEWFDFNDCRDAGIFPAACLMPAKEAQP